MTSPPSLRAVTVDGFGTLVHLADPIARLNAALRSTGTEASSDAIGNAFAAEVAHYRPRSYRARNATTLVTLRQECVSIFLDELGANLDPATFVAPFMSALQFDLVPGARTALEELRASGLRLACVANWDVGLHQELERLGVAELFDIVVTSADVGAPKPAPLIFERALNSLGVQPEAAVHIGDEKLDSEGAAAAGMRFEPVPLSSLPARIVDQVGT